MKGSIPWARVLLEGVVIVVSILLAFGVDAWWDGRANRAETRENLEAVRIELQENLISLDEHADYCATVRASTETLLPLMGPRPEVVSRDSLVGLVNGALSGGIASRLSTTALEAMIAEGRFASIESVELRRALGDWLSSSVDQRIQQRDNTRTALREASAYTQTVMPYALVTARNTQFTPHVSRFPLDVERVLSDVRLEGVISQLQYWRDGICRFDVTRRAEVERLLSEIDDQLRRP